MRKHWGEIEAVSRRHGHLFVEDRVEVVVRLGTVLLIETGYKGGITLQSQDTVVDWVWSMSSIVKGDADGAEERRRREVLVVKGQQRTGAQRNQTRA
jgi:hypothetical protein